LRINEASYATSDTHASVNIVSDEFVNDIFISPHHLPVRVRSMVLIDGGRMLAFGTSPDDEITYNYDLRADIDSSGGPEFDSDGGLQILEGRLSYLVGGTFRLGATFEPVPGSSNSGTVTIPPQVVTFDLGIVPFGSRLSVNYTLALDAETTGNGAALFGEFSDPFHLSANPAIGTFTFEEVGEAAAPEPGSLTLAAAGFALALAPRILRHRRVRRGRGCRHLSGRPRRCDS